MVNFSVDANSNFGQIILNHSNSIYISPIIKKKGHIFHDQTNQRYISFLIETRLVRRQFFCIKGSGNNFKK